MSTCPNCKTEIVRRRIPFGSVGFIEMECCECELQRLQNKYAQTGKPDNADDVFVEGL